MKYLTIGLLIALVSEAFGLTYLVNYDDDKRIVSTRKLTTKTTD